MHFMEKDCIAFKKHCLFCDLDASAVLLALLHSQFISFFFSSLSSSVLSSSSPRALEKTWSLFV